MRTVEVCVRACVQWRRVHLVRERQPGHSRGAHVLEQRVQHMAVQVDALEYLLELPHVDRAGLQRRAPSRLHAAALGVRLWYAQERDRMLDHVCSVQHYERCPASDRSSKGSPVVASCICAHRIGREADAGSHEL